MNSLFNFSSTKTSTPDRGMRTPTLPPTMIGSVMARRMSFSRAKRFRGGLWSVKKIVSSPVCVASVNEEHAITVPSGFELSLELVDFVVISNTPICWWLGEI